MNKVLLMGKVVGAPTAYGQNGQFAVVRLETSKPPYQRKDGTFTEERKQYHRCLFFNDRAQQALATVHDTDTLFLEGEINYSSNTDEFGNVRQQTDIFVQKFDTVKL